MRKHVTLISILSASFLLAAGCGAPVDLEPDDPQPDAGPPGPTPPDYPALPSLEPFPDEPVVTTPDEAPQQPSEGVDEGVHLMFPPPVSITTARLVTMRGTARLDGGVTAVRVNGLDALLSPPNAEGAVAWEVGVQVTGGVSELVVSSVDGSGNVNPAAASASITFSPDKLLEPAALALDPLHDRLFVTDPLQGLVVIDLATGTPTAIPLQDGTGGTPFPYELALDPAAGRALVLFRDIHCDTVQLDTTGVLIDLQDRSTASVEEFEPVANCEELTADQAAVLDPHSESFYYLHYKHRDQRESQELRRRPLGDGGPAPAAMPLCEETGCIVEEIVGRDRPAGFDLVALVRADATDPDSPYEVHAIDPIAGTQTRVATVQTVWDGTALAPRDIVLDTNNNRLLMLAFALTAEGYESTKLHVTQIDLATGAQLHLLADVPTVDGTDNWRYTDAIYDPLRGRVILSDESRGLIGLDVAGAAADLLFRPAIGDGPIPACPANNSAACGFSNLDGTRQRLFFHVQDDLDGGDIYTLDLTTGTRRLLSPRDGTLESGAVPRLLADDVEDRLLILHEDGGLYTVDGTTGERAYVGAVPGFYRDGVAWDPAQNRILYYASDDGHALRAFHVDTFEDQVISSDTVGSGPSLPSGTMSVTLDATGTRAFVSEIRAGVLYSVDLATGNRAFHTVNVPAEPVSARQPVVADTRRNRLLVGQYPGHIIGAIDLATGDISTLVDFFRSAPALRGVHDLLPDHANDRALLVDFRFDVYMLNLQTGERVLILQSDIVPPSAF